jgi:murein DD-endopeptidase MepM/ murein hydrolase activator NlpD
MSGTSDKNPVEIAVPMFRPSDGVVDLVKRNNRKAIEKSVCKDTTVKTAKVLTGAKREPRWYESLGNFLFGDSEEKSGLELYDVRIEEDSSSFGCPEPLNADDNAVDLTQITCDIDEGIDVMLVAGAKVQIRINNPNTCFTAPIGATIIKIIDNSPIWSDSSQNCNAPIPASGSAKVSTVQKACTTSRGGAGGPIKSTTIPISTTGVSPKGPLTSKDTSSDGALGVIISGFGPRIPPPGGSANHKGTDLRAPVGKKVYAALDGELIAAAQSQNPDTHGAGYYAVIKHTAYKASTPDSTFYTLYAHLTKGSIQTAASKFGTGKKVKAGQQIALSGDSGAGPAHLHFGVIYDNSPEWTTGGQVSLFGTHTDPQIFFWPNKFEKI